MKKFLIYFAVLLLSLGAVLSACSGGTESESASTTAAPDPSEATLPATLPEELTYLTSVGSGANSFVFKVVDSESKTSEYLIKTDKETVGKALSNLGMIEVDENSGEIRQANGIYTDYNKDGIRWNVYVNDEKQTVSVNDIPIKNGTVYTFKLEK